MNAADSAQQAAAILQQSGVQGGFVVHLGAGSGDLTDALRANSAYQVQGLEADATAVAGARQRLLESGRYGGRFADAVFRGCSALHR